MFPKLGALIYNVTTYVIGNQSVPGDVSNLQAQPAPHTPGGPFLKGRVTFQPPLVQWRLYRGLVSSATGYGPINALRSMPVRTPKSGFSVA